MSPVRRLTTSPVPGAALHHLAEAPPLPPETDESTRAPLAVAAGTVRVVTGSRVTLPLPSPLTAVSSIAVDPPSATPNISIGVDEGGLVVLAHAATPAQSTALILTGFGCTPDSCDLPFEMTMTVEVAPLHAPPGSLDAFTEPSPDRQGAAVEGALSDELLVTLGEPEDPGIRSEAEAAAAVVGGVVSGGIAEIGVYEIRWDAPQDLAAQRSTLETQPGITAVSAFTLADYGADVATPWVASKYDESRWTWPYEQVAAQGAWTHSSGTDVTVGIIDEGNAFSGHEDLNVNATLNAPSRPAQHATHVAGLACARGDNTVGMTGLASGCPVVSVGIGGIQSFFSKVLMAMTEISKRPGVKVVNISLGENAEGTDTSSCATSFEAAQIQAHAQDAGPMFRQLLAGIGSSIVWTFSAGNNCAPGIASPWGQNSDLDNVIVVGAANSDGSLASFSDYGRRVSVAAPGGVDTTDSDSDGLMSSIVFPVAGDDVCRSACGGGYGEMSGTSMSAPIVAGIAALVRSANPTLTAAQTGSCIKSTAGEGNAGYTTGLSDLPAGYTRLFSIPAPPIPIIDANLAVNCAIESPGTEEPPVEGSWSGPLQMDRRAWILSCASRDFCGLVGEGNGVTGRPGAWSIPKEIDSHAVNPVYGYETPRLSAISCPEDGFCAAVDKEGYAVIFRDSSWSAPSLIDPPDIINGNEFPHPLSSVSCASRTFCMAVDEHGKALSFNGISWSAPTEVDDTDPFVNLVSVSCPTATFCAAVDYGGGTVYMYEDGRWREPLRLNEHTNWQYGGLIAVSCGSTTFCVAIDGLGNGWTYDGSAWSEERKDFANLGNSYPSSLLLSCAAHTCVVAAEAITFEGTAIVERRPVREGLLYDTIASVACVSDSFCALDEGSGNILFYEDGIPATKPSAASGRAPYAVSCPSASFCMAGDLAGHAIPYREGAWEGPEFVAPKGVEAISCPSASFCAAVTYSSGFVSTFDGSSWSDFKMLGTYDELLDVSCASATFCLAVGYGVQFQFDGSNWKPRTSPPHPALGALSCPSASFCAGVNSEGEVAVLHGAVWSEQEQVSAGFGHSRVSCSSSHFCMAVGQSGKAMTYDGQTWSDLGIVYEEEVAGESFPLRLTSVSCVSAAFCVAGDLDGNVLVYANGTWGSPESVAPEGYGQFHALSCATVSFCQAIDLEGRAFTFTAG